MTRAEPGSQSRCALHKEPITESPPRRVRISLQLIQKKKKTQKCKEPLKTLAESSGRGPLVMKGGAAAPSFGSLTASQSEGSGFRVATSGPSNQLPVPSGRECHLISITRKRGGAAGTAVCPCVPPRTPSITAPAARIVSRQSPETPRPIGGLSPPSPCLKTKDVKSSECVVSPLHRHSSAVFHSECGESPRPPWWLLSGQQEAPTTLMECDLIICRKMYICRTSVAAQELTCLCKRLKMLATLAERRCCDPVLVNFPQNDSTRQPGLPGRARDSSAVLALCWTVSEQITPPLK